jgi:hypothetical protein
MEQGPARKEVIKKIFTSAGRCSPQRKLFGSLLLVFAAGTTKDWQPRPLDYLCERRQSINLRPLPGGARQGSKLFPLKLSKRLGPCPLLAPQPYYQELFSLIP